MGKNNQKGITLVVLTITIIILIILAGVTIHIGIESIQKANLEGLKTNMLLIETKAREYVENASFKLGVNPNTDTMYNEAKENLSGDDKGTAVTADDGIVENLLNIGIKQEDIDKGKVYKLTTENLEKMGINDVVSNDEEGWYIIVYNIEETTAEIYNTIGYSSIPSCAANSSIEMLSCFSGSGSFR